MRKIIFILLIILIFLSPVYSNVKVKVYNIPILNEDKLLNLPLNSYSYWYYISPGVEVLDNCYLNLYYSFSESLLEKESFLIVFINRVPLTTKKIVNKNQTPVNLKIKIPKKLIKTGFNEITISTRQRSIEGLCKDLDNDANWVLLHKNSILHMEIQDKPFHIKYYPYPFLDFLSLNSVNSKFYLLKDVSKEELEVLFSLANSIGTIERYKNLSYKVSLDDPYKTNNENQILIGYIDKWEELKRESFFKDIEENDGLIYSKKIKDNLQFYISGKGEGLLKSLGYISNPDQVKLTEKNLVIIKSPYIKKEILPKERKGVIRLKDLGFNNIIISGAYHQSASFTVKTPVGFETIQEGSFIELKFSHSPNLDPEKSILTLYIDGTPVKGERLDGKNLENGILRVNIPKDKLNQKIWNIEIKVYHSLNNADCDKRFDEVAWTKIEGDSLIYLIGGQEKEYPNLRNLWRGDVEDIYIWLPEKPSSYELSLISTILGKIGQNTGNSYSWKVLLGDNFNLNIVKDKTIIFIGSFNDERIEKLSNKLWVKPEGEKFLFKKDLG
ncbi:MAG: cellulose biosynthesis cyclic di-GMP-binding regulatory protein BcsB, partial [Dictyoglomus sp.]